MKAPARLLLPLLAALCCGANASGIVGDPRSLHDLGRMYRNGAGVARDSVRAFALIEAAAQRQHAPAMFTLSNMLAAGEGAPRDEAAARRWLEAAAELEYPEALQQLAMHVQEGALGYERDDRRAAQLLREAAHAMKHRP